MILNRRRHPRKPDGPAAAHAPAPPPGFDPARFPILALHVFADASAHAAHLAQLEFVLEQEPGARAA